MITTRNHPSQRHVFALALALCSGSAAACRQDPLVDNINIPPIANAGPSQQLPEMGSPVSVTLDGSGSTDPDGHVVKWKWFSATGHGDGDAGVVLPPGIEDPAWPDDVEKPQVELPFGIWNFSLWVVDDQGAVSEPSIVKITVGNADPLSDPQVAACVGDIFPRVPNSCKACICNPPNSTDDVIAGCRKNVAMSACGKGCWDLIDCVTKHCPLYGMNPQDPVNGLPCLTANCAPLLGGGAGATPAGACVIACGIDTCPAPVGTP